MDNFLGEMEICKPICILYIHNIATHPINYSAFFDKNLSSMVKAAILIEKGLKRKQLILEIGITGEYLMKLLVKLILLVDY